MTGWLPRQYLVSEPVAAARLEEANAEIERLGALLEGGESAVATELAHVREVEELNIELQQRHDALQTEFTEFRSLFESEINVHAENQRLADENAGLRGEVDDFGGRRRPAAGERRTAMDAHRCRAGVVGLPDRVRGQVAAAAQRMVLTALSVNVNKVALAAQRARRGAALGGRCGTDGD